MKLIEVSKTFYKEILAYKQEFIDNNEKFNGAPLLEYMNVDEWFEKLKVLKTNPQRLNKLYVPSTQFLYIRPEDNKVVGMLSVRHYLNKNTVLYGGHIDYSVCKSERQKGYATNMLKESLKYCKDLGLKEVLLMCSATNVPSRKVILNNGGLYSATLYYEPKKEYIERYWIKL